MIERSAHPLNVETPLELLRSSFLTPSSAFYVRGHGEIPCLDAASHLIRVTGRVQRPLSLSVSDLRTDFPQGTITAVLQCAGNRRAELNAVRPVSGDKWEGGAIGNAQWTGVRLSDILQAAGAPEGPSLHVAFDAADEIRMEGEQPFQYGVSIPMPKARSPEVLLAYAMNGEALRPEHGFPARIIVPGYAGVRSPKWITGITVQEMPSDTVIQQRDYKMFPPDVTSGNVDWEKGVTINETPLHAVICQPRPNANLKAGRIEIRGYAVASGRDVSRVEVSCNGGLQWQQAELEAAAAWGWTFWRAAMDLPVGRREIAVRAWDSAGQTQPPTAAELWNFKGYLCASWHRVPVLVT